ncbi:MAG: FAD-dependent oxidoreductase [Thermodesulfobacteriota bacterium]|nr:FAD-dependent oxidoreductase [Thermodesulfobacteriota bacterium]
MNRLDHLPTLRVNPEKKVSISFLGKTYQGAEGDTIATALYAGGVRIFARSLKYHRPRGLYSLDGECSNTLMEVDGIPNVRTENTIAEKGMTVKAQNVVGKSPELDLMGFMDKLSWAMPAGFYYRTMHKPAQIWPVAIKQVRKLAGLGVLSPNFTMKRNCDEVYLKADVCIIGGGPAGMLAALAASEQGLRVTLLENRPWLGGFFEYRPATYKQDVPLYKRARELAQKVEQATNIRVFKHTAMIGAYNNNLITAFQRGSETDSFDQRYVEIRAESVVVATGCIERPLLFENNERPGVMQIGCAHRLARTYGLLPGKSSVFSIGDDLGLEAAIDLFDLGIRIPCVADIREDGQDSAMVVELSKRKIPFFSGWAANKVHGKKGVKKVTLSDITGKKHREFPCDILIASAGLTPVTGPLSLSGAKLAFDSHTGFFLPKQLPEKMHVAGRMLGLNDPMAIEISGSLAGLEAVADCGITMDKHISTAAASLKALPGPVRGTKIATVPGKGHKTFICFDEDTTLKNVDQAITMGFDVPELIKRFASAGTGPGQGAIPGHNLALYVSRTHLSPDSNPKPTTVRPPIVPTYLATYAGTNHDMSKSTPVHKSQVESGGIMERLGVWNRARRFSDDNTAKEEIENVRDNVGMLDATTLGKFRVFGPDALKALQRVYVSNMEKLVPGRIKYTAMCNEDGCLIDDGVVIKRAENDYYLTTSTGRAGGTVEWFRYHTRYDNWDFHIVNLTDAFGVINLAGPNSRKLLEKVIDANVSNNAFPFAGYGEFLIKDAISVRAMRLGFVGELSYEFHVPASYMQTLWDILEDAGKEFGIKKFGLEAQNTLRMEKGHVIIGSESEQRTTLHDVGLGFLWDRHKPDAKTVGAVALQQTEDQKGRLKLVGFKMENPSSRAPKDGSLVVDSKIRGYVCMARYSHTLEEPVGMALVEEPLSKVGTRLEIFEDDCNDEHLYAKVVQMPLYDPDGKRMKM